ncbi:tigger transposable element-derived protein 4-like [Mercenaria mercenaria]|uniref:tigger transposable element-derived protein 4-like n=1 Tax=Mercenaria mercenaria TaxID=6596 RepID=UPI00234E7005|nr:tigger transposable element-derived protein 4-like [Mercenaria mercenaria]
MTTQQGTLPLHSDLSREGPGNQPGGIPSNSTEHVVNGEGPGNQPGGIPMTSAQRSKKSVKRKLGNYTLETKYKAIIAVEEGKSSKTKIAADFDIPQNTLSTWLKKAADIKESYLNGEYGPQRKRSGHAKFPEVEEAVLKWFKNARNENVPVSGPFLIHKANEFARALGMTDFNCSTGWLERFKERHGITFKKVCGESKSVDLTSDRIQEWNDRLSSILREYSPENIFNADETGLFYRALSDKTLEFKNVDCHGGKQSKERLTVMVCANMSGSEKVKLLIIGKSAKPRCFKNVKKLPTDYKANKKAWMVSEIFSDWVSEFDRKMHRKKRKVVLIVDNCPAHPNVQGLQAVRLVFLPPNTTSVTQPMDQGVIQSLKVQYRNLVMQRQSDCVDEKKTFVLSVLDAMRLLHQAWVNVKQTTIANCFRRANFVPNVPETADDCDSDSDPDDDVPLGLLLCGGVTLLSYAAIDDHVPTSESVSDVSIIKDIISVRKTEEKEESDDEDENSATQIEIVPPTMKKSKDSLDTLRCLVETTENAPDKFFQYLSEIGNFISKIEGKGQFTRQSVLTDFYHDTSRDSQ